MARRNDRVANCLALRVFNMCLDVAARRRVCSNTLLAPLKLGESGYFKVGSD